MWIGVDIFRHPESWIGYVPISLPGGLSREAGLQLNGAVDVVLGLLLVLDKLPKLAAGVAVAHLAGILITQGITAVIIRDVGLFGAALALLFWPHGRRRNKLTQYLFFWRRNRYQEFGE